MSLVRVDGWFFRIYVAQRAQWTLERGWMPPSTMSRHPDGTEVDLNDDGHRHLDEDVVLFHWPLPTRGRCPTAPLTCRLKHLPSRVAVIRALGAGESS
jgi:hypothetical protein